MLTKNLLCYKIQKNDLVPKFISAKNSGIHSLIKNLLPIFESSKGTSRAEIEEEISLVLNDQTPDAIIGRGLEKLLFDRLEFEEGGVGASDLRNSVFSFASQTLAHGSFISLVDYYQIISSKFDLKPDHLTSNLFNDLPMHQRVAQFKKISAESLIHRYNCAQVQGHLLNCQSLKIRVSKLNVAELRRLLRYVRFFNLVAQVNNAERGFCEIVIDGPLSLFFQTQKYGMALANFFPALLHMKTWSIEALIPMKPQTEKILKLDESCGIRSHYEHFNAFIPEEIKMFQTQFEKKCDSWKISPADEFLPLEGDAFCLPDFCFENSKKVKTYLEVFHAWHGSPLIARLKQLEEAKNPSSAPLLLGISKAILKDEKIKKSVEQSDYFKKFGFIFREIPTVDQVLKLL